ncbi:MAG: substrate-binding domain-containing protein [Thermoplasmata archaeon]|nr:substrate-binding domain-containing protein [Thermoplasmata archaeon]
MRSMRRNLLVGVVVVLAVVGGFAGGWYLRSTGLTPGSSAASLAVIAAGSLAPILPSFISAFVNATPGVQGPLSAQLYEGSTAAATALTTAAQPYDLFISADFRVIPKNLEPPTATVAQWEVVFASDPVVLAYEPSGALTGLNATNWYQKVSQAGVVLGAPNASADPLGANLIFTLELEDAAAGQAGAFYGHFFAGAQGALATPTAATKLVTENAMASALTTGVVGVTLTYRSYAIADRLPYLNLSAQVNLGGHDPTNVAHYGTVSTTELSGTGTKGVKGAPVLFAVTVPSTAPNAALGLAFASYLLSNATSPLWAADGFTPLAPAWVDHPAQVPAAIGGFAPNGLPALPSYLAAFT